MRIILRFEGEFLASYNTKQKNMLMDCLTENSGSSFTIEQLAQKLREEGYAVYTNVVGKQECIRGTLPLRCSICDFYFVTQISACVIGVRSGILDFTVNNGASYLVFYDNSRNGLYLKNYTLTGWKTDSRICEMLVPPEHGPDFFAEIYRNIQLLIGR